MVKSKTDKSSTVRVWVVDNRCDFRPRGDHEDLPPGLLDTVPHLSSRGPPASPERWDVPGSDGRPVRVPVDGSVLSSHLGSNLRLGGRCLYLDSSPGTQPGTSAVCRRVSGAVCDLREDGGLWRGLRNLEESAEDHKRGLFANSRWVRDVVGMHVSTPTLSQGVHAPLSPPPSSLGRVLPVGGVVPGTTLPNSPREPASGPGWRDRGTSKVTGSLLTRALRLHAGARVLPQVERHGLMASAQIVHEAESWG